MTPIVLPLVASLAAIGINTHEYRPAEPPLPGMADLRSLSSAGPLAATNIDPAVGSVIDGAAYPEAYRWTGSDSETSLSVAGQSARQSVVLADRSRRVEFDTASDASPDDDFDVTTGGGLVGIGFRWRFR